MSHIFNNPIDCAEDDRSRSEYIRRVVQNPQSLPPKSLVFGNCIPKVIVQFWDNLQQLPQDVQECLDTWKPLITNGFNRLIFDDQKARYFILKHFGNVNARAFDRCYHPAMKCDYFRLCYMLSRGGFYIDADEMYQGADVNYLFNDNKLKLQPLCYDIETDSMIKPDIFIKERKFSSNWIFYFNNNPLIAPPEHPIIRLALERATRLLLNSEKKLEIQSTTGPGNLTASVVRHAISQELANGNQDFGILSDWEDIATSSWSLSYRNDTRNWRLSNRKNFEGK